MRIVLDLQACQSKGSRFRGIGRYSWALAKAMLDRSVRHEFWVALNAAFPDTIGAIREKLQGAVHPERIVEWSTPRPTAATNPNNAWRATSGEVIREAFMESLMPDFVHVASLFEGFGDDAIVSIPEGVSATPVAATLYDLIPLAHRKLYLRYPDPRNFYYHRLDSLRRARLLFAISDSTRKEAVDLLRLPPDRVVNISTAVDEIFAPKQIPEEARKVLFAKVGLSRRFVMYTGGIDHRKNIEGLVRAYATLPPDIRQTHQLAVVCKARDADRSRLLDLAQSHGLAEDEVVLTGFVSDADLVALYNLCDLFVFPSWHEGFGLPALEAMACGAPVIASNTSSLPEVVGRADALFDPHKDEAIAGMMAKALRNGAFRQSLKEHGLVRAKLFSWEESARRALEAMEAVSGKARFAVAPKRKRKPTLAYVSPLPPERTGIADYSAELLPKLAKHYDIELVSDQAEITASIPQQWPWRSCGWFDRNSDRYDRVLYQFGNSSFHGHMFDLLEKHPGAVVLHDFYLGHICRHMATTGVQPRFWERALYLSHGYPALVDLREATFPATEVVLRYPCNWGVLSRSNGVIVHSSYCADLARRWYGPSAASRIVQAPLLRHPHGGSGRESARKALNLPERAFVTISLGIVDPVKLCDRLISSWAKSPVSKVQDSFLVFVGDSHDPAYAASLARQASETCVSDKVKIVGYVEKDEYDNYVAAADIVVQLRIRSRGETSAAILDGLASGRCVIVNAHGSAAELPDDCVHKISDEFTDDELAAALEFLWRDEARRCELGERGHKYLEQMHDPERVAERYRDAIEEFFATSPHMLLRRASREMMNRVRGLVAEPGDLERAAQSLAEAVRPAVAQRQLCVDISQLVSADEDGARSTVVHKVLSELLGAPAGGMRVEPVYAARGELGGIYRYARAFTARFLGLQHPPAQDEPLDVSAGDAFLGLDYAQCSKLYCDGYLQKLQRLGMKVNFLMCNDVGDASAFASAVVHWREHGCEGDLPGCVRLDAPTWKAKMERLFQSIGADPSLPRDQLQWLRYYLPVRDARLQTLCGRRLEEGLVTTGEAGTLMYGPYLRLARGRYWMKLYGKIDNAVGARVDVVSEHGGSPHMHYELVERNDAETDDGVLFSGGFTLERDVDDLEVRLHVGSVSSMCVHGVELRSEDSPETMEHHGHA